MDFLGFEMIFMGFYGILYGDSFLGGYSCEVFWGDPPRNRSTFFVHPTEETPGRGLVHPSFSVD